MRRAIHEVGELRPDHACFAHGRGYDGPRREPKVLWASDAKPRKDHDAPGWLTATEFEDHPNVTERKVERLAALLRESKHTVAYTGAGISASVVGQAALSGQNTVGWTGTKLEAQPTPTHFALAALAKHGLLHGWVQQNHDGLPQKAGFPQERICEVHGSWFDPSNPVVKYAGSLKADECEWMEAEAAAADLVLVLGTSLGGLNADQVAVTCAEASMGGAGGGRTLGSAIINLQQTAQDGKMTLSLKGKSDDVLRLLLRQLELPPPTLATPAWPPAQLALVPYDKHGCRLPDGSAGPRMWLDLRPGAQVRLHRGHNHQGAKQPATIHVGARTGQKFRGKEIARPGTGHGAVVGRDDAAGCYKLNIDGCVMKLGIWWLESAARGGPRTLPVVNERAKFEGDKTMEAAAAGQQQQASGAPRKAAASGAASSSQRVARTTAGARAARTAAAAS